ncbi:Katanin p80 WD40 repeat-containing subunit B1 [Hypsibius exemplaris]|uniref:Katanin p80 WD40 repeat-containing subunit B1 n=1 Tax=Hypsibius exemplaris TaxID=2072580 RepID=A0A1W0X9W7_HYPEX|nr:Katanin p80 WD40 repeat-containing subunit B1 [Hypsibius exemplaris]
MALPKKVTKIQEIEAHSSAVTCVSLGQLNGRVLATGGADCLVNLWVLGQKTPLKSLAGLSSAAECIKFDPSEESVVAGSSQGALKIWDLEADKIKRTLTGHKSGITALDFLPLDPNLIVSGSTDCSVKVWDLRKKACVVSLKQRHDSVRDVLFSPHGKWITSAGIDGTVQVYQWHAGKLLKELIHSPAKTPVHSLAFHPSDLLLATAGQDGVVKFWDLETFEAISSTDKDASAIRCIRFQKDGSSLLAGCDDILRVYGWEPPACFDVIPVGWGRVGDMAVTGNSSQLITASVGKTTVATYLVDLTRVRGKDSPPDLAEPNLEPSPVYRTLPRKTGIKKPLPDKTPVKLPVRSQSRDPISRRITANKAPPSSDHPVEIFLPKRKLAHSPPPRNTSPPSSGSSSSPSRGRGRSVSPSRKPVSSLLPSRHMRTTAQTVRGAGKSSSSKLDEDMSRLSMMMPPRSQTTESFPKPPPLMMMNNVPYRRTSFFPPSPDTSAQTTPTSHPSDYDSAGGSSISSSPAPQYRAPVMPVYPVKSKSQYSMPSSPPEKDRFSGASNAEALFGSHSGGGGGKTGMGGATLTRIKVSHGPFLTMLTSRLDNLRSLQQMGSGQRDGKLLLDAAVQFNDVATLVDVLNLLCTKPALWSLDCCAMILPHAHKLICHKIENYILTSTTALKLILKNFADLIKRTLEATPSLGVDISREERVQKSRICYTHLLLLKDFMEKDNRSLSQNLKKEFRQVKLLMQSLDN